ncbi:LysR substrate-binding domain-containing protein [Dyella psychrodurans]|uniref:LysR family transcriptional regulator n=1 Tax=Dyella psychrodurans TaxID=1927960 RepID=A0A370XD49_9GAMM|nr:LysR substrate-binding domain-containing protein [Dyella psychrodurans]RDS86336.1 LysR family transcriptional regulator [Dyella psychrodurans]
MLDLNDFYYFVQVVDRGGFTSASRTLGIPKSTLSGRLQRLESDLGVRLLNRTSRQFCMTNAGQEFYRHAVDTLQRAEHAENAIRQRLSEPTGTVRFTAGVITAQFAMRKMVSDFIAKYPKVSLVEHATDRYVDIVGENFDVAIRAHSEPLPNSSLVQRTLAPAPWYLFAGTDYLSHVDVPTTPQDLSQHPSLFMMRSGVAPAWHLSRPVRGARETLTLPLTPRLLSDDIISLKQAALAGLGIVALPGYTCCEELRSGEMTRLLPEWQAGDSTITALIPDRHGLLPAVRAFVDHLVLEFPKAVEI